MRALLRVFSAAAVLSVVPTLFAQQPTISHGQVTTEAADHGLGIVLDGLKRQKDAVWVGYSIPVTGKFSSDGTPTISNTWRAITARWPMIPMVTINRSITP